MLSFLCLNITFFTYASDNGAIQKSKDSAAILQEIHFNNFNSNESLLNPIIYDVIQDLDGFIWVATQDGLYRYDGNDIKRFGIGPNASQTLTSNYINALHADTQGRLWIATQNGINLFYPQLNKFVEFSKRTHPKYFLADNYLDITEDHDGNIWFASDDYGLTFYDIKTNSFTTYLTNANDNNSISSNHINDIFINTKNQLIVATANGLNIKSANNESFTRYTTDTDIKIPFNNIERLEENDKGDLWLGGTKNGLALLSLVNGTLEHFKHNKNDPNSLCANAIMDLIEDSNKQLWVATEQGLCQYFEKQKNFKQHIHQDDRLSSLPDNWIHTLFQDKGGVLWVGTSSGLSNWNAELHRFLHVNTKLGANLVNDSITSFAEDHEHNIYLGTWGGGIDLYSPRLNQTIHQDRISEINEQLSHKLVGNVLVDSKQNLWIATARDGLYLLPKGKVKLQNFTYQAGVDGALGSTSVTKVYELLDGSIAVATLGAGVYLYQGDSTFSLLQQNEPALNKARVYDIEEDEHGLIWIVTGGSGLFVYDRKQNKTTLLNQQSAEGKRIRSNIGYALLDTDKYMWIATQDAGVARLNKSKFYQDQISVDYLTSRENMFITSAYSMVEDDRGFIWATHSRGVSRIHPEELSVVNFNTTHNLQGLDFNSGAAMKAQNGQIYFGGSNGFNAFSNNELPLNKFSPNIKLIEFSLFNDPVSINQFLNSQGQVILKHSDSVIGFEFAALDFTQPEKNEFRYQMQGLSSRWVDLKDNSLSFSNLTDGSYTLLVKGSNNDGVWSKQPLKIDIVVLPPFWRTSTAYITYALISLLFIIAIYRRYQRKINEQKIYQHRLEEQVKERTTELQLVNDNLAQSMVETEKARDIAERAAKAKAEFLATMSHEIRTPMNSILGMNELLLKTNLTSAQNKYASMAYQSGESLLTLINDILDFSKMEDNKIKIEKIRFDLPKLIDDCIYLLKPVQSDSLLNVVAEIDPNCPKFIKGDELRYRQILTNLISNAIKFTKQGSVTVKVDVINDELQISIIDTGIGISPDKQAHIFDAFEQADNSTTRKFGGTGLGLSITKKLVHLMSGSIRVDSEQDKGAKFTICLPLELTENEQKYREEQHDLSLLELSKVQPAQVALVVQDRVLIKSSKKVLEKLKVNFQHITNSEHIFSFIKGLPREIILIEADILNQLDWQIKLNGLHQRIICMIDSHDQIPDKQYQDICFIEKPLNIKELHDSLIEKLALFEESDKNDFPESDHPKYDAKVLLVEDAFTNQIVATEMLHLFGCQVDVAENGLEAFNKIREEDYDIVFMDCQMPVMDGFEATRKIRLWQEVQNQSPALIIALTAGKGVGYLEECLGVGMNDFMLKPFNFNQLSGTLSKYLGHLKTNIPVKKVTSSKAEVKKDGVASVESFAFNVNELIDKSTLESIFQLQKTTGRDIFPKVLAIFKKEMEVKLPELLDAYMQQDSAVLYQTAHAIKSSAGNVGARNLVNLCQVIETAGLTNDLSACSHELKIIQKIYEQTLEQLNKL